MRKLIALGLMLTVAAAGCAGTGTEDPGVATARSGAATPTAGPSAAASFDPDAPLKFAKCMREQGISWFPDPDTDGRTAIRVPNSQDKAKMDAAMEACKEWSPDGGQPHQASPEDIERGRRMAQCMRENGVPNFPDPRPDGSIQVDGDKVGMGPGDPSFDKAEKACAKYIPEGATHEKQRNPA